MRIGRQPQEKTMSTSTMNFAAEKDPHALLKRSASLMLKIEPDRLPDAAELFASVPPDDGHQVTRAVRSAYWNLVAVAVALDGGTGTDADLRKTRGDCRRDAVYLLKQFPMLVADHVALVLAASQDDGPPQNLRRRESSQRPE